MNIKLNTLQIRTRQTVEIIHFSQAVTFIYGPIGTGKSTVARLVDFCFGGDLEQTPAIQQEFVSVVLGAKLGANDCTFERGSEDTQSVRVSWSREDQSLGSANAPLSAGDAPLIGDKVFNLSDLLFYLCDVEPIRVLQRSRDPDSPMIRLSFRDVWRYCYLDQAHLDSSFFRLEDPFRGRKSQDAMRFFTGLHSERLSSLQSRLYRALSEQH
ncbi:MAG: ATP-binding protein, partial [Cyanobacteriota bacterium]